MKITFKITAILVILSIILPLVVSCQSQKQPMSFDGFTISGYDILNYKIIYAEPNQEDAKWENYYYGIDYKFDFLTAQTLQTKIKEIFNVELELCCDTQTNESQFEILVGKTNREESQNFALEINDPNEMRCAVINSKLLLCGGNFTSTYNAIDVFINHLEELSQSGISTVALEETFNSRITLTPKNVAIIGDDVFSQPLVSGNDILNVSSVMQRLLWKDYIVTPYLEGQSTVRPDFNIGDKYVATDSHKQLIQNSSNIDIVIMYLGTYDNQFSNDKWDKTDDAIFMSNYINVINEMREANPKLKFYICTTIASGNNSSIIDAQINVYNSLLELDHNVELIRLDELMQQYLFDKNFYEGIYPDELASAIIAKRIAYQIEKG